MCPSYDRTGHQIRGERSKGGVQVGVFYEDDFFYCPSNAVSCTVSGGAADEGGESKEGHGTEATVSFNRPILNQKRGVFGRGSGMTRSDLRGKMASLSF